MIEFVLRVEVVEVREVFRFGYSIDLANKQLGIAYCRHGEWNDVTPIPCGA